MPDWRLIIALNALAPKPTRVVYWTFGDQGRNYPRDHERLAEPPPRSRPQTKGW